MTMSARERKYQREKDINELSITDLDVLNRFRIAVLVGEIESFKLIIKEGKNTYEDIWDKNWFRTGEAYKSKRFQTDKKTDENSYFNNLLSAFIEYGPWRKDPGERGYEKEQAELELRNIS